mgnify:CR=1 FL=1
MAPWWKEWDFEDIEGFVYQVGLLVKGTAYRKFISSCGGIRMDLTEIQDKLRKGLLRQRWVEQWPRSDGSCWYQATRDPGNAVYAGWLQAIVVNKEQ